MMGKTQVNLNENNVLNERENWLENTLKNKSITQPIFINHAKNAGLILNYSLVSLNDFEKMIFVMKQFLQSDDGAYFFEDAWLYLGETFIKNIGGKWKIDIVKKENQSSKIRFLPVISKIKNSDQNFNPIASIEFFWENEEYGYFESIFNGYIQ